MKRLAIKQLFDFPPHPTSASTLPGETHGVHLLNTPYGSNTCNKKIQYY